jgi:hypothetical protein
MNQAIEYKNRNWALILSGLLHAFLIAYLFFSLLSSIAQPEPIEAGIMIAIGEPDESSLGEEPNGETLEPTKVASAEPAPSVSKTKTSLPATPSPKEVKSVEKTVSSKDSDAKATVKENNAKTTPSTTGNKNTSTATTTVSNTNGEAEAAKAAAEAADAKKKKYGTLFGKGQGTTDGKGNQGDPNGEPDAKALEGISKGRGTVGEGLASRPVKQAATVSDNSQKHGKVVVKVCVDRNGKVISAKFTQKGSTTTDADLVSTAERGAMRYVFSPGEIDSQCGTIAFDFKLN